ncbi:carotenoid biosynthesis protein [uncultured Cohaesibacter sp.]|uniref:carotenoid biosynthesis protein n=1 Tax=uncultured Cohaesibacter sp. TaxID=1002546 RepID=UPI0029C8D531|nr:carotenoid biosynthesis protein [uncultured Cohaesibacter sp.]
MTLNSLSRSNRLPRSWIKPGLWGIALLIIAVAMIGQIHGKPAATICLVLTLPFAIAHGAWRYGWKTIGLFFGATWLLSNAFENLSILTGFPFGHYHYTGGYKIFLVPAHIGIIYCGLGYVSWLVAATLLDEADLKLDLGRVKAAKYNLLALPLVAGAVMTMWDVSTDSLASTVQKTWIWENGGGFFGVPYTNYLGWWFVTWSFFQVFALILSYLQVQADKKPTMRSGFLLPPVLIYGSLGLSMTIFFFLSDRTASVTDMTGKAWSESAIIETTMIVSLFTVVPVAILAIAKLLQGNDEHA